MNDFSKFLKLLLPWQETPNDQISDIFVYIIGASFLILLIYFSVKIFFQYNSIKSLTRKIPQSNGPAKPSIQHQLKSEFERKTIFKEAWQEFEDSLVTRKPIKIGNENEEIVYKTDEASFFFSEDRLLGQYMNLRFWNNIPAILVGLGILGTFIGLVWGLIPFSGIDFGQTREIQGAIKILLSGVSTAFVTSVWGMVTSLFFNGIEKLAIGGVSSEIANLQRSLDKLFRLTTQQEIAIQQEDQLEQQTAIFQTLFTDLGERITEDIKSAMVEGRQEILHELNKTVEAFSTTISDRLTRILEELKKAIEELRQQKEESSAEAIKDLIEKFQESLSSSTVTQMEELAKTVGEASQSLKDLPEQIAVMIASVQAQINETRRLLSETSQEQIDQMKQMMGEMINTLQSAVKLAASQTGEQLNEQTEKIKTVSEESIQTLQTTIAGLSQTIAFTLEQQQNTIVEITSQTAQASTDATNKMSELINQTTERLSGTVHDAEKSIETLLQQQKEQTEVFNAQITNSKETLESGQKMLAEMEASVSSVRIIIEEAQSFSEQLTTGANQLEKAGLQLMQAGAEFNEENEKYLTSNRETIQQLLDLHERTQQLLDNSTERFNTIDGGLQSIFSQIETGLNTYAVSSRETINTYLSDFATQLTAAVAALSNSIEALEDNFEDLNDRIEQLLRR